MRAASALNELTYSRLESERTLLSQVDRSHRADAAQIRVTRLLTRATTGRCIARMLVMGQADRGADGKGGGLRDSALSARHLGNTLVYLRYHAVQGMVAFLAHSVTWFDGTAILAPGPVTAEDSA